MSFYFEATPDSGIDDGTLSSSHDSLYDKSPLYRNLVNDITADGGKVEIYASGGRFSSAANAEGLTRPDPGLLNGVEIFISTTATADNLYVGTDGQPYPQTIERILAHEMFHAWQHITGKLSDIPYENESAAYKFENLIMQEAFNEEKMRLDDDGTNVNPVQEPSNSSNVNHYNDNGDKTNPELDPPDISSPVSDAAGHFNNAKDRGSPLVLDLDGDGIELSAFDQTNATFFDLDEDGEAEQTGWVDSDDGLLAVDANGNGEIDDNSELFGSMTEDGFSQLQAFDSNGDGVINASDADFEKLLVWQDLNQDGKSQEGELQTLSDWNITEIDLSATEVTVTQDGHDISHTSTFTMNGVTQDIKDVCSHTAR